VAGFQGKGRAACASPLVVQLPSVLQQLLDPSRQCLVGVVAAFLPPLPLLPLLHRRLRLLWRQVRHLGHAWLRACKECTAKHFLFCVWLQQTLQDS